MWSVNEKAILEANGKQLIKSFNVIDLESAKSVIHENTNSEYSLLSTDMNWHFFFDKDMNPTVYTEFN